MTNQEIAEKVHELLIDFLGNEKAVQVWLSHPREDLGGQTPQNMIDGGSGEIVLDMLEAALAGARLCL
ncbi:MAG: antitoxin Xre/MbcA/ParS toxin-binding domain-containing protein [Patescibacteria group bacterium]